MSTWTLAQINWAQINLFRDIPRKINSLYLPSDILPLIQDAVVSIEDDILFFQITLSSQVSFRFGYSKTEQWNTDMGVHNNYKLVRLGSKENLNWSTS